jgi:hypothetical protein
MSHRADQRAARDEPRRVDLPDQQGSGNERDADRDAVDERGPADWKVTTAMRASDATLTPSRNAPAQADSRTRDTSGRVTVTRTNPGKKIPSVATAAPGTPPRR